MGVDRTLPPRPPRESFLVSQGPSRKRSVSHRAIARRAVLISWTKRLLPAAALMLLTSVVLWPEFSRITETSRNAVRHMTEAVPQGGELIDAHYRGVDQRGRPYTITASSGRQVSSERVNLTTPIADLTEENGHWVWVQADHGVYLQHLGQLDLSGSVVLYRDDGTFIRTQAATLDLKTGFAAGAGIVSVEGPFGTIDATAFAVADKGQIIQFTGPARMIMNQHQK
jgi:lipopolysaccharide export system protein LptC